jgi:hypothetical protein
MSASREKKTGKSVLNETSVKVGKALARSTHTVEETGHKIKNAAEKLAKEAREAAHRIEETVDKKVDRIKKEAIGLKKKQPAPRASDERPLFSSAKDMAVEACIGFLAGDIYQYLDKYGAMPVDQVSGAMRANGNSPALINAALGWLAREARITFSADGSQVSPL